MEEENEDESSENLSLYVGLQDGSVKRFEFDSDYSKLTNEQTKKLGKNQVKCKNFKFFFV